jgi:hypothetical protein
MALVDRYRSGERSQVWDELLTSGERIRSGALLADAQGVADETMRRARRNVEKLINLLPGLGWTFARPIRGAAGHAVFTPSEDSQLDDIERLEQKLGVPVPLSIATWWRVVGSVDFTRLPGSGPPVEYPDPLVVLPPSAVLDELAEWREDEEFRKARPTFLAPLAPDSYHKEDVSGGAPYEIALPNPACDAEVLNLEHSFTFVAYLRHTFRWAGLPGYAEVFSKPPPEIVAIAAQLEPL